jgi:hypothetical protein
VAGELALCSTTEVPNSLSTAFRMFADLQRRAPSPAPTLELQGGPGITYVQLRFSPDHGSGGYSQGGPAAVPNSHPCCGHWALSWDVEDRDT